MDYLIRVYTYIHHCICSFIYEYILYIPKDCLTLVDQEVLWIKGHPSLFPVSPPLYISPSPQSFGSKERARARIQFMCAFISPSDWQTSRVYLHLNSCLHTLTVRRSKIRAILPALARYIHNIHTYTVYTVYTYVNIYAAYIRIIICAGAHGELRRD